MEKVTDRILWSILVLAIGVGIFVVSNRVFVKVINRVLHRDVFKEMTQVRSVSSDHRLRFQPIDLANTGLSSHGYGLLSTKFISDNFRWVSGGVHQVSLPSEVGHVPIPYNSYAKFLFRIKVNKPLIMMFDVNNQALTGSNWSNTNHDNDEVSRRRLIVDGKTMSIGIGPNQTLLSANMWHTVEVIYFNTDPVNVHQVALSDQSALKFMNNNNHMVTFWLDDFRYAVDDQKYL